MSSERIVADWDIGNQPTSRSARSISADRELAPGVCPGSKRHSNDCSQDLSDNLINKSSVIEEDWCLNDVIFVEDGRTQPVGIVLKIDGDIAAVKFLKVIFRLFLIYINFYIYI